MDLTQIGIGLSIVGAGTSLAAVFPMKTGTRRIVGGIGVVTMVFGLGILSYGLMTSAGSQDARIHPSITQTNPSHSPNILGGRSEFNYHGPNVFGGSPEFNYSLGVSPNDVVKSPVLQPKLSVDSELNPMSIVYENKMFRRKVSKRARIMVIGVGKKSIDNVKAFVTKVNDVGCRWQLPVTSLDTLFERSNPSPVKEAVTLNPGEEQYFDALVECIAPTCPNGELAVPDIANGHRLFGISYEKDPALKPKIIRPKTLTIEVFGDGVDPVTKTFIVSKPDEQLLLHPQLEETRKQDNH